MRVSIARFKDLASAAQSVAVVVAVVIGGIWTLYVFTSLAQREKAELDVKKALLEKAKQELQPRAILDIKLSISQPDWPKQPKPLVQVIITAKNNGNRLEVLHLPPAPVHVHALLIQPSGELSLRKLNLPQLESHRFDSNFLSPTEVATVAPILIAMPSSGLYLFEVCVPLEQTKELESIKREPN
ncbi:MAG TPA: hypothetical protein VLJ79_13765, partial [Candidatus Binatia bacterium]|nr:hypothetical protein [Candidatus Binatia bacterium]